MNPSSNVIHALHTYQNLIQLHKEADDSVVEAEKHINVLKDRYDNANPSDKIAKKTARGELNTAQSTLNKYKKTQYMNLAILWCNYIFQLDKIKKDGLIPNDMTDIVQTSFLKLAKCTRMTVRYKKLPIDWLRLGAVGGVLEEMVVIMRTPNQIGLGMKHMFTVEEIINGLRCHLKENQTDNRLRFIFLTYILDNFSNDELNNYLKMCIIYQGQSKRIGIHSDDTTDYYYAIQGLYGNIEYDPRVTKVLTPESFNDSNTPTIGVHFSKTEIVNAIWNKEVTKNNRANGKDIPVGMIVRFDRVIHALSCVHKDKDDDCYRINDTHVSIRNRMVHGIAEAKRPKYEAGLVLDIEKMVNTLPPGSVMMNELGTLLIKVSIPYDCLLTCLNTDEMLEKFWHMDK